MPPRPGKYLRRGESADRKRAYSRSRRIPPVRATFLLLLLLVPAAAGAQSPGTTLYKCLDPRGQVTYSNVACDKQGLKSSGTVTEDRVTTMPLPPVQKPAAKPPAAMPGDVAPKEDADGLPKGGGPRIKPVSPVLEKLVK